MSLIQANFGRSENQKVLEIPKKNVQYFDGAFYKVY